MKSRLLSNIFSLTIVKIFDIFIPILLIPYLIRVLGSNQYGIFATCLVSLNFLLTLTDFGINVYATRLIATAKNKYKCLLILRNVIFSKLVLLILAVAILLCIGFYYGNEYKYICIIMTIALVGDTLSPLCYYQGLQKLRFYAIVSLIWRAFSAFLVLLVVKSKDDLLLYTFIHSVTYLFISFNLIIPIISKFSFIDVNRQLKRFNFRLHSRSIIIGGWQIYSYRCMSGLFLPILTNYIALTNTTDKVAVFNVIQRLFSAAYRFFEPINSAIYPYLSKLYIENRVEFIKKSIIFIFAFFTLVVGGYITAIGLKSYIITVFIGNTPVRSNDINAMYILIGLSLVFNVMNLLLTHCLIILRKASLMKYFVFISFLVLLSGLAVIYYLSLSILYVSMMSFLPSMAIFFFASTVYIKSLKIKQVIK